MTKDLKGLLPESWLCVDCGVNTASGLPNRVEMEKAIEALGEEWEAGKGIEQTIDHRSEVYTVRDAVWKDAGMEPKGGCLCIGCLEKHLGRPLRPKDFLRGHAFNDPDWPASPRLMKRRGRRKG